MENYVGRLLHVAGVEIYTFFMIAPVSRLGELPIFRESFVCLPLFSQKMC
jgi:hypothetical protein